MNFFKKKTGLLTTDFSKFIIEGGVDRTLNRILFGFDNNNADGDSDNQFDNGFISLIDTFIPANAADKKQELKCFILQFLNYKTSKDVSFDTIKSLIKNPVDRQKILKLVTIGDDSIIFKEIKGDVKNLVKNLNIPSGIECYDNAGNLIPTPVPFDPITKSRTPITKYNIYMFLKLISDTDTQKNNSTLEEYKKKLDDAIPTIGDGIDANQGWPRAAANLAAEKTAVLNLIAPAPPVPPVPAVVPDIEQIKTRTNNIVELIRLYNLLNEKVIKLSIVAAVGAVAAVPAKLVAERNRINKLFYTDDAAAAAAAAAAALTYLGPIDNDENQFWVAGAVPAPGTNITNNIGTIRTATEKLVKKINLFNELNKPEYNVVYVNNRVKYFINEYNTIIQNVALVNLETQTQIETLITLCDVNLKLNTAGNPYNDRITAIQAVLNTILDNILSEEFDSTIKAINILTDINTEATRFEKIKATFKTDDLKKIEGLITKILSDATTAAAAAADDAAAAARAIAIAAAAARAIAIAAARAQAKTANKKFLEALDPIERNLNALKVRVEELYARGRKLGNVTGFSNNAILEEYKNKLDKAVPIAYAGATAAGAQGWPRAAENLTAEKTAVLDLIDEALVVPAVVAPAPAAVAAVPPVVPDIEQIKTRTNNIVELIRLYNLLNEKVIKLSIVAAVGAVAAVPAKLVAERTRINDLFYPAAAAAATHLGPNDAENQFWVPGAHAGTNITNKIGTIRTATENLVKVISVHNDLNAPDSVVADAVVGGINNKAKLDGERARLNGEIEKFGTAPVRDLLKGNLAKNYKFSSLGKDFDALYNEVFPMVKRFLDVVKIHNDNQKNVSESYAEEKKKTDARIEKITFDNNWYNLPTKFNDKNLAKLQEKTNSMQQPTYITSSKNGKTTDDLKAKYTTQLNEIETHGFVRFDELKKQLQLYINKLNTTNFFSEEKINEAFEHLTNSIKNEKLNTPLIEIFKPTIMKLDGETIEVDLPLAFVDNNTDQKYGHFNIKKKNEITDIVKKIKVREPIEINLKDPYYLLQVINIVLSEYFNSIKIRNIEINNIEDYDNVFYTFNGIQINIKHTILLVREIIKLLKRNGYDINHNTNSSKKYEAFMTKDFYNNFITEKGNEDIAKTFYQITNQEQAKALLKLKYGAPLKEKEETKKTDNKPEENFKIRVQAILGDPNDPNDPDDIINKIKRDDQRGWLKNVVDSLSTRVTGDKNSTKFLEVLTKPIEDRTWALANGSIYNKDNVDSNGSVKPNKDPLTKDEFYNLFFGSKTFGTAETRIAVSTTDALLKNKPGFFTNMFGRGGKQTKHKQKRGGKSTRKKNHIKTKKIIKMSHNKTHKK